MKAKTGWCHSPCNLLVLTQLKATEYDALEASTALPSPYSLLCPVLMGWGEEIEGWAILSPRGQFGPNPGGRVQLTDVS